MLCILKTADACLVVYLAGEGDVGLTAFVSESH